MYYIGIDIGGTGVQAGVVTEDCKILGTSSVPTRAKDGYEAVVEDMANAVALVLEKTKVNIDEIKSIGIGCPGSIDDKKGVVYYCNNISMRNAPLCEELKKYYDKPVFLGNDANCAALGEFFGLNDDSIENFVAITLGTGVGGGVIIGKKLFTGSNGIAAELGHIKLMVGGEMCSCGRDGCWEAYASATAIIRDSERAAKANPDSLLAKMIELNSGKATGKIPFDAAEKGDKTAIEVKNNYIKYVGEGLIDIINIFQPQVIAIGGGISRQGDKLINPVKKYVLPKTYGAGCVAPCDIRAAAFGNDAGILGAAFLGR